MEKEQSYFYVCDTGQSQVKLPQRLLTDKLGKKMESEVKPLYTYLKHRVG